MCPSQDPKYGGRDCLTLYDTPESPVMVHRIARTPASLVVPFSQGPPVEGKLKLFSIV